MDSWIAALKEKDQLLKAFFGYVIITKTFNLFKAYLRKNKILGEDRLKADMPSLGQPAEEKDPVSNVAQTKMVDEKVDDEKYSRHFHVVLYGSPNASKRTMQLLFDGIQSENKILTRFIKFETELLISKLISKGCFVHIYYSGHGNRPDGLWKPPLNCPMIEAVDMQKKEWAISDYLNELYISDKVTIICEACNGNVSPHGNVTNLENTWEWKIQDGDFTYALFSSLTGESTKYDKKMLTPLHTSYTSLATKKEDVQSMMNVFLLKEASTPRSYMKSWNRESNSMEWHTILFRPHNGPGPAPKPISWSEVFYQVGVAVGLIPDWR